MGFNDAAGEGMAHKTGADAAISQVVQNQLSEQIDKHNAPVCTPENPTGIGTQPTGLPGLSLVGEGAAAGAAAGEGLTAGAAAGATANAGAEAGALEGKTDGQPWKPGDGEGVCTLDNPYGDGRKPPDDQAEFIRRLRERQPMKN